MTHPLFHVLLFSFHLPLLTFAQSNGKIFVGASLGATDDSQPWLSPSGDFAFGFQKLKDKDDLFLLSIWFNKIPEKTIVWYPYKGNPVPKGSKVDLTSDRGLVLSNPQNQEMWYSDGIADTVSYGLMNDTGNFVLVRSDSQWLWESFKNPSDTLLPTQILETDGVLFSRLSQTNFSQGRFQLRLLKDGNLVLNFRNIPTNYAYDAYYISNTYDSSNASNSGYQVIFDQDGYMYVLRRNKQKFDLTPRMVFPITDYYHRATLDFDGVFVQYYHPKRFTGSPSWTVVWYEPENICRSTTSKGSGVCGFNNVCTLDNYKRPSCKCPTGFRLLNPNDTFGSCMPSFTQSCMEDGLGSSEDLYDFVTLTDTDWPLSDYEQMMPYSEEDCKRSCLQDCFCAVAIQRQDSCWKKKLPLSNGRNDASVRSKAFLKYRKGSLPDTIPSRPPPQSKVPKPIKDLKPLVLVGSILLGSSIFVNFVLVGAACLGFYKIHYKKSLKFQQSGTAHVESNLRYFTYKELVEGTCGFRDELGRGGFGTVYKGTVYLNSASIVAVKKLDRVAQNTEKEFRTEVNVIGNTHHKNLVKLVGFCDEGQHRLLVYEYLGNGSLARFLFGDEKLGWKQRTQIAIGISRGLTYLHEECGNPIIHCDIKSQNILLDDYYNARISDFGLAKLLMMDQSRTDTGIRGTKGFVAPEWFRNAKVTVKVDVYSFGVLLLEIISCRKSLEDLECGKDEQAILTDWVWECFSQRRLMDLLDHGAVEALNDMEKLERFVMVGIWCIQEDPSMRPTMRSVSQMLEGVVEVANPPCPFLFTSMSN